MKKLTKELVRELLDYNPKTGEFTWKERSRKWFDDEVGWKKWNGRFAGKQAFFTEHPSGYLIGTLLRQAVYAHRLAFLWMTGKVPQNVAFKDDDRTNIRWKNLLASDVATTRRAMPLRDDNTSGTPGVWFETRTQKWCAAISDRGGKRKGLGRYATKEEAVRVRRAASLAAGYSAEHGRRAS